MDDELPYIVFGVVVAICWVVMHWETALAAAVLIVGVGLLGVVTWLGYPACLFAYGSGLAWLATGWAAREVGSNSDSKLSTATGSVLRSLADTARWTFVGVGTVTLVQLSVNAVLKLERGDVSVLSVLDWQARVEALNAKLKLVGSPWLFFPIALGCLWLTYRTRSDAAFRALMNTKKYLGRAATALMAIASFSFASHEYAEHLERMWQPRWSQVIAEQAALHEKAERHRVAAEWVKDQLAQLDDDAKQRLAAITKNVIGHEEFEAGLLDHAALRELKAAERAPRPRADELPAAGMYRSLAQEMNDFLAMNSEAAPPVQSPRVVAGEARLQADAKALGVAESIAVQAAKTVLSGLLPSGMDSSLAVVVKAIIGVAAKTAVGSGFPQAVNGLSRLLRTVDQVRAERSRASSEPTPAVVEAEPFPERLADDDPRWVELAAGQRDAQAVFDPPSNHVSSGSGSAGEWHEREREREVEIRERP